jgi:hypothetical protein
MATIVRKSSAQTVMGLDTACAIADSSAGTSMAAGTAGMWLRRKQ